MKLTKTRKTHESFDHLSSGINELRLAQAEEELLLGTELEEPHQPCQHGVAVGRQGTRKY